MSNTHNRPSATAPTDPNLLAYGANYDDAHASTAQQSSLQLDAECDGPKGKPPPVPPKDRPQSAWHEIERPLEDTAGKQTAPAVWHNLAAFDGNFGAG